MPHNNCEAGYSLISMLLALSLFTLTLPFLIPLIKHISFETNYQDISVHHFFHALHYQLLYSYDYDISHNQLYLSQAHDEEVKIEKYGSLIRRQVNGLGHEIYLRDVQDITFKKLSYGIQISLVMTSGESYEKSIVFYE